MKEQLVSVIVMTYKNFEYLKCNIESIAKQNYKNIELIISDDSSDNFDKDKINQLVTQYKDRFQNIIIQSNKRNLGTVKNFNNSIKISKGDFIIPLSVDDYFAEKNSITEIIKFFNENLNIEICTTKRKVLNNNNQKILPTNAEIEQIKFNNKNLLNVLCKGNFISGSCTYYRRIIFDDLGFFDEDFRLMEDYPFYIKYLLKSKKIGFLDIVSIIYREGGVSSIDNLNPIYIEDWNLIYTKMIFNLKKELDMTTYRTSKLDYVRLFKRKNKVKYFINHLFYIDIVILKAVKKIFSKI